MHRLKRVCSILAVLLALASRSFAVEDPPTRPMLRIETGMHAGVIKDMAVDAAETFLVTCSQDTTLRVWDLASGDLMQTMRVPIAGGPEGMLYSVAVSPDGKSIVTGGLTGYTWDGSVALYIFDRVSGKLTRRITGLPDAAQCIRFSPDGKFLAVGMASDKGVRIYRFEDGKQVAEDKEYRADCIGVCFASDGRLAASGLDGLVRVYNSKFELELRKKTTGGTHPHQLSFSPDGKKIAVGFGDSKNVNVLAADTLALLYSPTTDDIKLPNMAFDELVWSADGKKLFGAGRAAIIQGGRALRVIRRWENEGKGDATDIPASLETITALTPLKSGQVLFASGTPAWGVLSGDKARYFDGSVVEWKFSSLMLSDNANTVQFTYEPSNAAVAQFHLAEKKLDTGLAKTDAAADALAKKSGLHGTTISTDAMKMTGCENEMQPKVNGHPVEMSPNETNRCVVVLPDDHHALLGSDFALRLVDNAGKTVWSIPTPGAVWDVNVSSDGAVGVAALHDGTLRWFLTENGKPIVSLFLHNNQKQWVMWTRSGYYDAAAGSEDLIGWHINRGKEQAADFFPASRFRGTNYRPDVLDQILTTRDEAAALKLADDARGKKTDVVDVDKTLPPVVRILSPENNDEIADSAVTVKFSVRSPADAPVTSVRALVDGRPAGAPRRIVEVDNAAAPVEGTQTLSVTLPNRDCEVAVIAENKHGASSPGVVRVRWKGKAADDVTRPKLYVFAVGVSKYKNPEYTLDFAAKDAGDFASTLALQKGKLYRDVEVKLLTDDQATKEGVLDGLEWIQKQTTSRDVAMIFLSGHGVRDGSGDYYFVPYAFENERKRATGVVFYEVEKTIKDIAGKVIFFVDTCHSGGAGGPKTRAIGNDIVSVVNELSSAENGAVVFAASTGKEYAQEDPKWGHGAFTKALLEGLSGKADLKGDGRVTIASLDYYLSERVKELTDGGQHPTTTKPPSVPDFPISFTK